MRYSVLLAITALPTTAYAADPACEITGNVDTGALGNTYDPFSPQDVSTLIQLNAVNHGEQACTARFYVAPLDGALRLRGPTESLSYYLDGPSGGSRAAEHGPFVMSLPAGGSQSLNIRLMIPAHQIVPKGSYTGQLTVRGVGPDETSINLAGSDLLTTIEVAARAEMSISGASAGSISDAAMAPASMNFPNAQTGQSNHVFVNVWANSSVTITLDSENRGLLKHLEGKSLPPITYSARFDGDTVALAGSHIALRTPPMSLQGASYKLEVTLGDTTRKYAGTYQDTILVHVNAN